jgi:energy-dependent translational throttle protein EttA
LSWIRVKGVTKGFGSRLVLRDVNFRLTEGDRVGVIGANGTGKTTLLKLMLNLEDPDSGTIETTDGVTVGYFSQFSELSGEESVLELLDAQFTEVHDTERALAALGDALAEPLDDKEMTRLLNEQAELFEHMEHIGGWTYENQIDTVLTKLGFSDEHRLAPISQLSGGWRNRAALAELLLKSPDVLLMDEPTNYLDVDGLRWLEGWFQNFTGALLVISHDRDFLDAVVTSIVEVENFRLQHYEGNYSDYVPAKHFRLKDLAREFAHEQELLVYEKEAIKDRREAQRSSSKSLDRKLANIKKSKAPRPVDQIVTSIYENLHVSKELCEVVALSKSYAEQTLFNDLAFDIRRRDRWAVLGPNGCGKSTLLRVMAGEVTQDSGKVQWRKGAQFVSFNHILEDLDLNDTLSHAVNSAPGSMAFTATKKSVNRFLTLFQFSELDLKQRLGDLSGGQRARVALVMCLLSGASVILLDEPTNHLDIASAQVMERALLHFPGAVVVVSHDRFFIDKVATQVLTFNGEGEVTQSAGLLSV